MDIPFYVLLIIYLVGIFGFLIATFLNMYHLLRFGFFDFTGRLNAFVFIGFCLAIILVTVLLLWNIPWMDTFDLFSVFQDLNSGLSLPTGATI